MESPVVTATAGLLLFPVSTTVPTVMPKPDVNRSLGIPNATNGNSPIIVCEVDAVAFVIGAGQVSTPYRDARR